MPEYVLQDYLWLVVIGSITAFIFGYGTGARREWAAVGSKTLTLRQAVLLACIFEFTGAMVLGRVSTDTIAGGISDVNQFAREPEIYAYGMMVALAVGGVIQIIASALELNISATHCIVSGIIGFSVAYGGPGAVIWSRKAVTLPGQTPPLVPYKGCVPIFFAWFISPIATGVASAMIFSFSRFCVLRRSNAYKLSFFLLPLFVFITVWINVWFVLTKGAAKMLAKTAANWTQNKSGWVAALVALGCSVFTAVVLVPLLYLRINKLHGEEMAGVEAGIEREKVAVADAEAAEAKAAAIDVHHDTAHATTMVSPVTLSVSTDSDSDFFAAKQPPPLSRGAALSKKLRYMMCHGMEADVHHAVVDDPIVAGIHANAEVFDSKAERVFSYLQVLSAICVIFAHGAGEVGYMAGPLGAIWQVYTTGNLKKSVVSPIWIVLLSALGLVLGLATFGYQVTAAMGTKLAKLTPSRGFAAELATATVILIASQNGLPTSSSQCIIGGIVGVALCEGVRGSRVQGLNVWFFARQVGSWAISFLIVALITAAIFSQAVYAPSVNSGYLVKQYEGGVGGTASFLLTAYTDALKASGFNTSKTSFPLMADIATTKANIASYLPGPNGKVPSVQTVLPFEMLNYLTVALALLKPAMQLNLSSSMLCPAIGANASANAGACTLNTSALGGFGLTKEVYGVTTQKLDRKKAVQACLHAPCNQ